MAAAIYATRADVDPMIGNLATQRSDAAVNNAIAGASAYVNMWLGRAANVNVDDAEPLLEVIRSVTRLLAAAELIGNVQNQLEVRQSYLTEARSKLESMQKFETGGEASTDYVKSSSSATWPANPAGVIYSTRYKNLRKTPKNDLDMYQFNLTTPDTFNLA